uniref:proteasome endopeptidase complex n=1 Tax=Sinocyclocheilus anshuiensis TaxID=1608454 RepID=A0A671KI10_9TELE
FALESLCVWKNRLSSLCSHLSIFMIMFENSAFHFLFPPWQCSRKNRVPTLFSSTFSSLSPHQQPFHCKGLICCPISQKIMPIHSHLVVNISGSGADCMLWERILTCEMRLYQLRHRKRLSVNGAAKLLSMMLHPFKAVSDQNTKNVLSTFGGRSGPRVCYVCSDGLQLKGEMISVGSGSPYAYAVLDDGWRWGMTVDEAVALAREAVFRATHWDAYSGNNVDLFHITAHGWRRRDREDLKEEIAHHFSDSRD